MARLPLPDKQPLAVHALRITRAGIAGKTDQSRGAMIHPAAVINSC